MIGEAQRGHSSMELSRPRKPNDEVLHELVMDQAHAGHGAWPIPLDGSSPGWAWNPGLLARPGPGPWPITTDGAAVQNTRFPCLLHYMYLYFTSCFLKRSKKLSCVSNNTILHMYWKLEPVSKKTCRYLLFIPIRTRYFQVQIRVILASYIIL